MKKENVHKCWKKKRSRLQCWIIIISSFSIVKKIVHMLHCIYVCRCYTMLLFYFGLGSTSPIFSPSPVTYLYDTNDILNITIFLPRRRRVVRRVPAFDTGGQSSIPGNSGILLSILGLGVFPLCSVLCDLWRWLWHCADQTFKETYSCVCHHQQSVLPKGRSFTACAWTHATVLPKAGLTRQTQAPRLQFF